MVSLAFAIAASANFPVLFASVLWKDCTTKGAVIGGSWPDLLGGADGGVALGGKPRWQPQGSALFPYTSPAVLDDHRLCRHLREQFPDPHRWRACPEGSRGWHSAPPLGDGHRRGGSFPLGGNPVRADPSTSSGPKERDTPTGSGESGVSLSRPMTGLRATRVHPVSIRWCPTPAALNRRRDARWSPPRARRLRAQPFCTWTARSILVSVCRELGAGADQRCWSTMPMSEVRAWASSPPLTCATRCCARRRRRSWRCGGGALQVDRGRRRRRALRGAVADGEDTACTACWCATARRGAGACSASLICELCRQPLAHRRGADRRGHEHRGARRGAVDALVELLQDGGEDQRIARLVNEPTSASSHAPEPDRAGRDRREQLPAGDGSEGRGEPDPQDRPGQRAARRSTASEHPSSPRWRAASTRRRPPGYPPCPGNIMLTNPCGVAACRAFASRWEGSAATAPTAPCTGDLRRRRWAGDGAVAGRGARICRRCSGSDAFRRRRCGRPVRRAAELVAQAHRARRRAAAGPEEAWHLPIVHGVRAFELWRYGGDREYPNGPQSRREAGRARHLDAELGRDGSRRLGHHPGWVGSCATSIASVRARRRPSNQVRSPTLSTMDRDQFKDALAINRPQRLPPHGPTCERRRAMTDSPDAQRNGFVAFRRRLALLNFLLLTLWDWPLTLAGILPLPAGAVCRLGRADRAGGLGGRGAGCRPNGHEYRLGPLPPFARPAAAVTVRCGAPGLPDAARQGAR